MKRRSGRFLVVVPLFLGLLLTISGSAGSENGVPVGAPEEPASNGLGPLETAVLVGGFLGGLAASVYLAFRLRRGGQPRALEA